MANKVQRKVNAAIRKTNKAWAVDSLLNGRFVIRQIEASKQDDVWYFKFKITDTQTGIARETGWTDQYDFYKGYLSYRLFDFFNDFIIRQLYGK